MIQDNDATTTTRVFLSYSRMDHDFALWLRGKLEERGVEVFHDVHDTLPGEQWWQRLQGLITKADTVVFVLSPHSVASEVCTDEVAHAVSLSKRIFPVVIADVDWARVPEGLANVHSVFFKDKDNHEAALSQLHDALLIDITWVREHTELHERAVLWEKRRGSRHELLRGRALEIAEQWLNNQPNDVKPPSLLLRNYLKASRDAARQRRNLLTGSLAVGLLIALALAAVAYWQRGVAITQRELAERNFAAAKQAADGLVFDIAQGLRDVEGLRTESVSKILQRAAGTFDELAQSTHNDPSLMRSRAVMFNEFAKTYLTTGNAEQATRSAETSLEIASVLEKQNSSDAQAKSDVAAAYMNLGDAARMTRSLHDARIAYERALEYFQKAATLEPDRAPWQRSLSSAWGRLAQVSYWQGDLQRARAEFESGRRIDRTIVARWPDDKMAQRHLATTYNNVGNVAQAMGDHSGAREQYEQGVESLEELAADEPGNTRVARSLIVTLQNLGDTHVTLGDLAKAKENYERSLTSARNLSSRDPANTVWLRDVTLSLNKVGDVCKALGDYDSAERLIRESQGIREELVTKYPDNLNFQRDLVVSLSKIGVVLQLRGQLQEARSVFESSVQKRKQLARKDPNNAQRQADVAVQLILLGDVFKEQEDFDLARNTFVECLAIYRQLHEESPDNLEILRYVSVALNRVGEAHQGLKDYKTARTFYEEALAIRRKLLTTVSSHGEWQRDLSVSLSKIGETAQAMDDQQAAHKAFFECLEVRRQLCRRDPKNILWSTDLVEALWQLGELETGEIRKKLLSEALKTSETLADSGHLVGEKQSWPDQLRTVLSQSSESSETRSPSTASAKSETATQRK